MISKIKSFAAKRKSHAKHLIGAASGALVCVASTISAFASDASTGININFEPTQMFTYSNVIIECLMPVVYITAGLSLGFTIIYSLKSAFSSRM